jgi:recombination protein RecR
VPALLIEPVARLIESFARLPGIGPKTAQRLTYHLLRAPETEARALAAALIAVREQVVFCDRCFNISDRPICAI